MTNPIGCGRRAPGFPERANPEPSRLDGAGGLWRWGGFVRQAEVKTAAEAIQALVRQLAAEPGSRTTIGLIQLESGPESGGACAIPVASWKARLDTVAASARRRVIVIASPEELLAALRGGTTLAIVNPYGEWLPAASTAGLGELVDALGRFVREGGHWVETGGYSFYAALVPRRYLEYEAAYPPVFADFVHLASSQRAASRYSASSLVPGAHGRGFTTPRRS